MLPIAHRLTHTPVIIHPDDQAWDHVKINRELAIADLREAGAVEALRSGDLDSDLARSAFGVLELDIDVDVEQLETHRARIVQTAIDAIESSPWATREDHPVDRYWSGASRRDVDTIRGYLLPGVVPTRFVARFLTRTQRIEVSRIAKSEGLEEASCRAVQLGLVKIEGPVVPKLKAWEKGKAPELAARDLDTIAETFGLRVLVDVGAAIFAASAELLESEKKV